MKNYVILFCILLTAGCGASRAAPVVVFQNETPPTINRDFTSHFENALSKKTTAHTVVYKITDLKETSSWSFPGTESSVTIWAEGRDIGGVKIWEKTESAKRSWRFTGFGFSGGSVYSCIDDIVKKLP